MTYFSALCFKLSTLRYTLYAIRSTFYAIAYPTLKNLKSQLKNPRKFPISCMRSRYENLNTLMGNGKSEILGTPKPWNVETLEHWNFRNCSLIP